MFCLEGEGKGCWRGKVKGIFFLVFQYFMELKPF